MKVKFYTLGCKVNQYESQAMTEQLLNNGYELCAGKEKADIIVVNSGQVHFTGTDSALTYHCLILDDTFCRMANLPYQQTRFETAFRDAEMEKCILDVVALQLNEKETFRVTKLQIEVARLLILLHQRHIAATRPKERSSPAAEGVRAAIRYLREHYGEPVTLDALSRAVYME